MYDNLKLFHHLQSNKIILILDSPTGVYFVVYEGLQDFAKKRTGHITPSSTIFAGGTAGMVFWSIAVPFDVLKSRLQSGKYNERSHLSLHNRFLMFNSARGHLQAWHTKCFP